MTIEPHEPPAEHSEGDDGLPRGEWPGVSLIAVLTFLLVVLLAFTQLG